MELGPYLLIDGRTPEQNTYVLATSGIPLVGHYTHLTLPEREDGMAREEEEWREMLRTRQHAYDEEATR